MRLGTMLRGALVALLALAVVAWLAVRRAGILPPSAVASLAAAAVAVAVAVAVFDARRVAAERRLAALGSLLLSGGVAFAGAAGLATWLWSVHGFALLAEREPLRVATGDDLQSFGAGPFGGLDELQGRIVLDKLVLEPAGGGFRPVSRVTLQPVSGAPRELRIAPGAPAAIGSLRLHQGAFGFAPRIVVLRGKETLFDAPVPFRTRLLEGRAVAFEGDVDVPAAGLRVEGEIDLSSLDENLRGHPGLHLRVQRGAEVLGGGDLLPGHFAEVGQGYRVGYAGVVRWSEVDVRRRPLGRWVWAGLGMALAGAVLWPVAAWRRW